MTFNEFLYKNRPTIIFLISLTISFVCLTTEINYYLRTLRSFFVYFFYFDYIPIYEVINYPIKVVNRFIKLSYLYEENLKLKEKIRADFLKSLQIKELDEQQKRIQQLKKLELEKQFVSCKVIYRDYTSWFDHCIVILSTTSQNSINEDAPVVLHEDIDKFYFIGRIWTKEGKKAKILLITNPLSAIPAKVKNKKIEGVILGNSSIYLTMDYVLEEDDIKIGDVIVTSGLNNIPEGIEIGNVIKIEKSAGGFKKVIVKPTFNINFLKELLVIIQ